MPSRTIIEELLTRVCGRIERLDAGSRDGLARVRSRVAALRREEASTRAAVQDAAASVEHSVRDLDARVEIAERSTAADRAEDLGGFLDAVMGELRAWDVYLERRQFALPQLEVQDGGRKVIAGPGPEPAGRGFSSERPHPGHAYLLGRARGHP